MDKHEHFLFFASEVAGDKALLSKEEIGHALSVLRMDSIGKLQVTDGRGNIYECSLVEESAVTGEVRIASSRIILMPVPDIHVFIGLPDRDAFEEVVTDLSAMGVARIVPLIARYCQKSWWERWEKHSDRLKRKMITGIKQSHNPRLPLMQDPMSFTQAGIELREFDNKHCIVADQAGVPFCCIPAALPGVVKISCIIGPPGGFSHEEMDYFKTSGYTFVNIAPYRLRTELAAVILCGSIMQTQMGMNS